MYVLIGVGTSAVGIMCIIFLFKEKNFFDVQKKEKEAKTMMEEGETKAEELLKEAKQRLQEVKERGEEDEKTRKERIEKVKEKLDNKEKKIEEKEKRVSEEKLKLASFEEEVQSTQASIERIDSECLEKLSLKVGKTPKEAKESVVNTYVKELEQENGRKLLTIEDDLRERAEKIAKNEILGIMQRISTATSVESKTVFIKVPQDRVKGKIVGKDARNILLFEEMLEVSVIFNELPNIISIAGYNLVVRRIAEKAMNRLVGVRGEINEKVVKDMITLAKKETDDELYKIGSEALKRMGIKNDNKEFTRIVGRLQYRTSYGQNILKHSMEVGWIATMLGSELGLNVQTCKVGGFLHDLGKAIDQDPEITGTHDTLTKELMEKFGFSPEEVHAAWTHHDAEAQTTPEALIVKAADAISGGRPGARQDTIERYIEKIKALEATIGSFDGVKKSFTMSAGREVRVYVDPEMIEDKAIAGMAVSMAEKIEQNVTYPGKIRVNVFRRTKITEIAK